MRVLLEKALVHLLNGDQDKAAALFHKYMVERAREIHESLRQNDDVQLNENWDAEISEEEYFDDLDSEDDVGGAPMGDTDVMAGDAAADAMGGDDMAGGDAMGGDDMAGDDDMAGGDEFGGDDLGGEDDLGGGGDLESKVDDLVTKVDDIGDKIDQKLGDAFDRLMAKLGDEEGADDDLEDFDAFGADDESTDDFGGDEAAPDMTAEPEGAHDDELAGRMEDDMGDEGEPDDEMTEDDESMEDDSMLEDITESVLAELDRVAAVSNTDGKEIGSAGKTVGGNHKGNLPSHGVKDRVEQAKPFLVKAQGDAHNDSFERETPPTNKEVTRRRNNDAGVKKLKTVPAKGDASAELNSDFAASGKSSKPIIDGSKKVR